MAAHCLHFNWARHLASHRNRQTDYYYYYAAADTPDQPVPIASPLSGPPLSTPGGQVRPRMGGGSPTPLPSWCRVPGMPIIGGEPPKNIIPLRMAIFDTSVPLLRSGTDKNFHFWHGPIALMDPP